MVSDFINVVRYYNQFYPYYCNKIQALNVLQRHIEK